ncbi:MAG: ABC transporter substrate-binding protein [Candidatus Adiutricales bacterium]
MVRKSIRTIVSLLTILAVTFLLVGMTPDVSSAAKVFKVGYPGPDPTSLDPHAGLSGGDHNFFKQIFDPLVEVDPKGQPIPALAVSWENPSPKEWIFHLRKGVTFHDGTPFNAAAVKFNIERLQDEATKSPVRGIALKIKAMDLIDDHTIKMTLDAPNVDFPIVLQDRPGMIVSPAAVKKYGLDFGRNPVGTGAFVFDSWQEGSVVKMHKNPNYWNKENVHLDKVEIKIIPDGSVAVMSLLGGDLDLLILVPLDRVKQVEKSKKLKLYITPALAFQCVYMMGIPPFDKKEIRQALAYSVDRESITKALTFGYGQVATGHLPRVHWAYEGNVERYPRNIQKAKELLKKAGYPNGVKATLTTIPAPPYNKIAQIVKEQAAEAGFDLTLEMLGPAQAIGKAMKKQTNALSLGWSGRASTDATYQSLAHSSGAYNNKNYVNPVADALIERARSTSNIEERKKIYSDLQKLLAEDMVTLIFFNTPLAVAAKKGVTGYENYLDGKLRLTGVKSE